MNAFVLLGSLLALGLLSAAAWIRRRDLVRMRALIADEAQVRAAGGHRVALRYPVIDRSICLGCATCVTSCPEDGVLELVHGQAMVVQGARCVGVAACERECPVGAISITEINRSLRDDVPAVSAAGESLGTPGLFLAGEVTAHALIKTAVDQGSAVARAVIARRAQGGRVQPGTYDLCIVGAGPAGLACALEARAAGLSVALMDREHEAGGTVAKYPRRKLVLSQPFDLPGHGRLARKSYEKEELIELWDGLLAGCDLDWLPGRELLAVEPQPGGDFVVQTSAGPVAAATVCLAIGRRGLPRRLGVPGEELPKVAWHLLDAHSYQGRNLLVVGGGDSAVEAALALAEQPGNQVTLAYRGETFYRLRARNAERLEAARRGQRFVVRTQTEVLEFEPDAVVLATPHGVERIANDEAFVMIGGVPSTELLARSGVSMRAAGKCPSKRPQSEAADWPRRSPWPVAPCWRCWRLRSGTAATTPFRPACARPTPSTTFWGPRVAWVWGWASSPAP
ncbi:MAG: NAD(P)-binding domain-containing protein [Planctomycetota bacterium]